MDSGICACAYLGLQIGCTADHPTAGVVTNSTSDEGTLPPRVLPLYEERTSSWTLNILADSIKVQANAEAGFLDNCNATSLYHLTLVSRHLVLVQVVSVQQNNALLIRASTEELGHYTPLLAPKTRKFPLSVFLTQCAGQSSLVSLQYVNSLNLSE